MLTLPLTLSLSLSLSLTMRDARMRAMLNHRVPFNLRSPRTPASVVGRPGGAQSVTGAVMIVCAAVMVLTSCATRREVRGEPKPIVQVELPPSSAPSADTEPTDTQSGVIDTSTTARGAGAPPRNARKSAGCALEVDDMKTGEYIEQVRQLEEATDTWLIRLPGNYDPNTPSPLLLNFHGAGSNAQQQVVYSGFDAHADEDNAIIVAPKSRGVAWEPLKGPDVELIDYLLAQIPADYCVDLDRIYSTGMSSGAYTTGTLACRKSDEIAAFGTVTANFYIPAACDKAGAVDIMSFHGTKDPIVPFGTEDVVGGIATKGGVGSTFPTLWAQHDGCDAAPTDERIGEDVTKRVWPSCGPGGSVTLYVVDGGGHTWPGAIVLPEDRFGHTTATINATDLLWKFFMSHTLGDS